jgi:hypothetical protein
MSTPLTVAPQKSIALQNLNVKGPVRMLSESKLSLRLRDRKRISTETRLLTITPQKSVAGLSLRSKDRKGIPAENQLP